MTTKTFNSRRRAERYRANLHGDWRGHVALYYDAKRLEATLREMH